MSWVIRTMTAAALAAAVSFSGGSAAAEESEAELRTKGVIQERKHQPHHEFRVSLGYLPQDPFYKAAGPDVAYTWHRSPYFSWEILRLGYFASVDSEIRQQLRAEFDAIDDPYEKASYMVTSHAQFTPFYGRYTVMNRGILYQETYFTGGGGMIGWTKPENGDSGGGLRPTVDGGLGFRWYASSRMSVKLELLEQFFMRSDGSIGDQFYLTFGASYTLGRKRK